MRALTLYSGDSVARALQGNHPFSPSDDPPTYISPLSSLLPRGRTTFFGRLEPAPRADRSFLPKLALVGFDLGKPLPAGVVHHKARKPALGFCLTTDILDSKTSTDDLGIMGRERLIRRARLLDLEKCRVSRLTTFGIGCAWFRVTE